MVTRYDMNRTFTTVIGGQHPGCEDARSVRRRARKRPVARNLPKVAGNFDYNPNAIMPANPTFDNFIAEFFTASGGAPDVEHISYEFDYYLVCALPGSMHWRDQSYGRGDYPEGNIEDCL